MALDPQCKAFLDRVKSFNIPDLPVQGVHFARSNGHGEPDISGPLDPSVRMEHRYLTTATADVPITIYTPSTPGPKNGLPSSMAEVGFSITLINMMPNSQQWQRRRIQ